MINTSLTNLSETLWSRIHVHSKFNSVVLIRGSHFKTIFPSVIFTPPMCRFGFNSRWCQRGVEMTPNQCILTLILTKWLQINCILESFWNDLIGSRNDSIKKVKWPFRGQEKRLYWRSQNDSFELTVSVIKWKIMSCLRHTHFWTKMRMMRTTYYFIPANINCQFA